MIDAPVTPHGAWQGASVGTLVSLWLCHILAERAQGLVAVRAWVAARPQPCNTLLDLTLRATACTEDRLAHGRTMVGDETTQAPLARALLGQWVRGSRWPTETMRLDSPSVRVSHDATTAESLVHQGPRKDHRPDLRQCKAMLATRDPLGLPLVCQPVAGTRAAEGLSGPASAAAVTALGTSAVLVGGESTRGALGTRGHSVAGGSGSLCASRPPAATDALATWREQALARSATWQGLAHVHPQTGDVLAAVRLDAWERAHSWQPPVTQQTPRGRERVLGGRSSASQAGLRRRRARALARLSADVATLWHSPGRGRTRSRSREALEQTVAERLARAGLTGGVQPAVAEERLPDGTTRWIVAAMWPPLAAWPALVERLGWQVDVTNTTTTHSRAPALVASSQQHALEERGFSRLQTRHLPLRPVSLRDATRLAGLRWLLCLALRVLPLTAHRLRTALAERGEALTGLNPASRTPSTSRPTTERVLAVFPALPLTTIGTAEGSSHHVTPRTATQRHILAWLALPDNLDERFARPATNFVLHLRE